MFSLLQAYSLHHGKKKRAYILYHKIASLFLTIGQLTTTAFGSCPRSVFPFELCYILRPTETAHVSTVKERNFAFNHFFPVVLLLR